MEQEIASIIRFVLEAAENPHAYYWEVPEDFTRPSIFFPDPEIVSGWDTIHSYYLDYMWFILFYHTDTIRAHRMAMKVGRAIKAARNRVPLIEADGTEGETGIRLGELNVRAVDKGVVQLTLRFKSRRRFARPDVTSAKHFVANIEEKQE